MPKIPTFTSEATQGVPGIEPGQFSRANRATAQGSEQIAQIGLQAADTLSRQYEEEKAAERTLKSIEIDNGLKSDIDVLASGYADRDDYENFDKDREKQITELRNKYMGQVGDDKVLRVAFERRFSQETLNFSNVVRTKKRDVMSKRALGGFATTYNQALQNYAGEQDPTRREIIRKDVELGVATMVASRFMDEATGEKTIQKFIDESEKTRADQMIEADPASALEALKTGDFAELAPADRQAKVEKAILRKKQSDDAAKVEAADAEKKQKEAEKVAHDQEERSIGDLFVSGDYAAIIPALKRSKYLKGDELATWTTKVKEAVKSGGTVDKTKQAAEIIKINQMIAGGEDPAKIRNHIAGNPNILPENQEQYIGKLESKLSAEITAGRNDGNTIIHGLIFPKAGLNAAYQNTPLQTQRTAEAQLALDDWIDDQQKAGKSLTRQEIKQKAIAIGHDYSISFAEMNQYQRDFTTKQMEEVRRQQGGE